LAYVVCCVCAFSQPNGGNPGGIASIPNFDRESIDYQGNIPATDSGWNGAAHPTVECFLPEIGVSWNVDGIVYKTGETIHGTTVIRNNNFEALNYTTTNVPGAFISPASNDDVANGTLYETRGVTYTITSGSSGTISGYGTATINWTATGVPNYLCAGQLALSIKFNLSYVDIGGSYVNQVALANTKLAIVTDNPVDTMQRPWADFAYEVGLWGWGATNQASAHAALVNGIHYSNRHAFNRLQYDYTVQNYYFSANPNRQYNIFKMRAFIQDIRMDAVVTGDCKDFASTLGYVLECNGINSTLTMLRDVNGGLSTNPMCPAIEDSTDINSYSSFNFNFHMLTKTNLNEISDCSSSYFHNLSGTTHFNPVHVWLLPDYWQKRIPFNNPYLTVGLCESPNPATLNMTIANIDWQAQTLNEN
jgi:hypothetical protein